MNWYFFVEFVTHFWRKPMDSMQFGTISAVDGIQSNPISTSFWRNCVKTNQLKYLLPIARRALCVPASEAPSERVFSKLSLLIGRLRNRISPDLLRDIMFLSCNRKLFRELNVSLRPDQVQISAAADDAIDLD